MILKITKKVSEMEENDSNLLGKQGEKTTMTISISEDKDQLKINGTYYNLKPIFIPMNSNCYTSLLAEYKPSNIHRIDFHFFSDPKIIPYNDNPKHHKEGL